MLFDAAKNRRDVFCYGIMGFNESGKSTLAKYLAKLWKSARPGMDVLAFDPQQNFGSVANKFMYEYEDWIEKALELRNGLLIMDDISILHTSNQMDKRLVRVFSMRPKTNIDIIYIIHGPKKMLEGLDLYTSDYFIFYTQAKKNDFRDKISDYEPCFAACNLVRRYIKNYGKGTYPDFPYIHINNGSGKMSMVNMDQKKVEAMLKTQKNESK